MRFRYTKLRDWGLNLGWEDKPWWKQLLLKYYYGNTIEYYANVEGEKRIRRAQKGVAETSALHNKYAKECVSDLPEVKFDGKVFEEIRALVTKALEDPAVSPCIWNNEKTKSARKDLPLDKLTRDVRRFTKDVHAAVPGLEKLLTEDFVNAIRARVGSNFFLENIMLTRNYPVDDHMRNVAELLSERWHFDDQYTDGFSVFVCISDVTKDDGPFTVVNRPDSMRILRHGYSREKRVLSETGGVSPEEFDNAPSLSSLTGKPGSKMLCHTSFCLHKGGVPKGDRHRDMMILAFRNSPEMDLRWPRPQ